GFAAGAAVERRWRRDGDLRGLRRMRLDEAKMLDHGMAGKADLADGACPFGARTQAGKGDALRHLVTLDAVEAPEEIEMPPRAAELAVGDRLQSRLLLPLDDPGDLAVLDLLQRPRIDLAALTLLARLLYRGGAQEAADMIGAEGRLASLHLTPRPR